MGRPHQATFVAALLLCAAAAACDDGPTTPRSSSTDAALSAASAATRLSTSTSTSHTIYGVHNDVALYTQASTRKPVIQYAVSLHAKIARTSIKWSNIEGSQGTRNWSGPDGAVSDLQAAGIAPLFVLWGSPSWINGSSTFYYVPTDATKFAAWVKAYASFAGAAAARYKGRVKYWELWNEENIADWWAPKPNLTQYITWYKAVYAAIKAGDPSTNVGMGGITNLNVGGTNDVNGHTWLTGMYQAGVFPDAVVIHPYAAPTQAPNVTAKWLDNFTDIAMIHNIMTSWGQGGKQLWLTEWGWKSSAVGETTQANYTAMALNMIATQYTYVTLATIFLEQDGGGNSQGLYRSDGSMRPAGSKFQSFAASH